MLREGGGGVGGGLKMTKLYRPSPENICPVTLLCPFPVLHCAILKGFWETKQKLLCDTCPSRNGTM